MPPHAPFYCLDLPDSFPDSLDELRVLIDRYEELHQPRALLASLALVRIEDVLAERNVVAELAVLSLPFVQLGYPDALVDQRRSKRRHKWPCPQWERLVQEIAIVLVNYDEWMQDLERQAKHCHTQDQAALRHLESRVALHNHLRQRRYLTFTYANPDALVAGQGEFTKMLEVYDEEIYAILERDGKAIMRDYLLAGLHSAVYRAAPADLPYTKSFVNAVLATILGEFGLATGTSTQIAASIQKSFSRMQNRISRRSKRYPDFL